MYLLYIHGKQFASPGFVQSWAQQAEDTESFLALIQDGNGINFWIKIGHHKKTRTFLGILLGLSGYLEVVSQSTQKSQAVFFSTELCDRAPQSMPGDRGHRDDGKPHGMLKTRDIAPLLRLGNLFEALKQGTPGWLATPRPQGEGRVVILRGSIASSTKALGVCSMNECSYYIDIDTIYIYMRKYVYIQYISIRCHPDRSSER